MDNNILNPSIKDNDQDVPIRPNLLNDFIGQKNIKENLTIFINAARKRNESLDHTLFYGPPGLGKTSLSQIIAKEMGSNIRIISGPSLSKAADLASILTNLQENDVLFIDEIHRLNISIEEILYSAMEDFVLDIMVGDGPGARSVRINLPKFTLVGATTRLGLITNPLRDRFGISLRLSFYEVIDLVKIIKRAADILFIPISSSGLEEIARRSRGTPRIALRLLKRVRDFSTVKGDIMVDNKIADQALNKLQVDKAGLDSNDFRYLQFIATNYAGGPVGVDTIAVGLSEQRDAIEEVIEPYLIQIGMLQRTARGRVITDSAFDHIGMTKMKG